MAAKIAEMLVDLKAETVKFRRDMKAASDTVARSNREISRSVDNIKRQFDQAAVNVSRFVAGYLTIRGLQVFTGAIRDASRFAAEIRDTAAKVGLTTDALQELRFAAEQTGVATQTLDMAMQRFSRRVGEAAQGGGELLATLEQYDIALRNADGSMRPLEAVLGDYAEAIRTAESDQERLRLAFKGFDSEGAALVNTLRRGEQGLEDLRQAARDAGAVMDSELVQRGGEADDRLAELSRTLDVQLKSALIELAPVIERLGALLVWLAEKADRVMATISLIDAGIALLSGDVPENVNLPISVSAEDERNPEALRAALAAQEALLARQRARAAEGTITEEQAARSIENITRHIEALEQAIVAAGGASADYVPQLVGEFSSQMASASIDQLREMNAELERRIAIQRENIAAGGIGSASPAALDAGLQDLILTQEALQALIDAAPPEFNFPSGGGGGRAASVREERDAFAEWATAMQNRIRLLGVEQDAMRMGEVEGEAYRLAQEAILEITRESGPLTDAQIAQIKAMSQAYAEGEAEVAAFRQQQEDAARAADEARQAYEELGRAVGSAFEDAIVQGRDLRSVLQGLLSDLIRFLSIQTGGSGSPIGDLLGLAFGGLGSLFGGGSSGGRFSGPIGGGQIPSGVGFGTPQIPGRAQGGPVAPGLTYLVGEEGPELFTSSRAGHIVSNDNLAGGTYYIDARGADSAGLARLEATIRALNGSIEDRAVSAVADARRRNPRLFG